MNAERLLERGYTVGRMLKGVGLLFLAFYLVISSYIQIRFLSTLEFEQEAIDAINFYYGLLLIPIVIFVLWGLWTLIEPVFTDAIQSRFQRRDEDG